MSARWQDSSGVTFIFLNDSGDKRTTFASCNVLMKLKRTKKSFMPHFFLDMEPLCAHSTYIQSCMHAWPNFFCIFNEAMRLALDVLQDPIVAIWTFELPHNVISNAYTTSCTKLHTYFKELTLLFSCYGRKNHHIDAFEEMSENCFISKKVARLYFWRLFWAPLGKKPWVSYVTFFGKTLWNC